MSLYYFLFLHQKTPLSKAGDPVENLVQVYPQVVDLTMRPGNLIGFDLN